MKTYQAKTVEEALEIASKELEIPVEEIVFLEGPKVGLFAKKITIDVYELPDIIMYAEEYVLGIVDSLGIESTVHSSLDNDVIRMTIDSTHNPILIGKNGKTLQSLNELTKLAVSNHFHKRFRILLDINGYKDNKYYRLSKLARKCAKEVQNTKTTYTFDPMPADERRIVHNAIANMPNVKSESIGEGTHRQVQIIYVD